MKRRTVTLLLDGPVAEFLESLPEEGRSEFVNAVLRKSLESQLRKMATLSWLEELNDKYGHPTPEHYARAQEFVDELMGRSSSEEDQA